MKEFILNNFRKIENEKARKSFLIYTFGTIGMLTSLAFCLYGYNQDRPMSYIFLLFSLFSLTTVNLIYFLIRRNINVSAHILISSFLVFCLLLFAFIGINNSGVLWYFVFSPLAILLTNLKRGLIYNILLFLFTIFFIINPIGLMVNEYPTDFLLRFILAYPIVNIFILIFEYTRSRAFLAYTKTVININERNNELLQAKEELKQHNKQLKESEQQLREINATKDKLFSIIAHDLRSPFNTILGYSEELIENVKDNDSTESEKFSVIINSSAKNTLTLLDNLLNWAKSQIGQSIFNPRRINLASTIQEIIAISSPTAKIKNISINYIPSDNTEVYADINMLKTVLRNLLSNAIKFTNIGGKVNIWAIQYQNHVEITVSDNGVGMNKETINKLFKIDSNYTTKGTAKEGGSGLGLVLCKEFVEKHGGKIWVESEEGKGSDFKFTLPNS
jgi:signal transduction histidine kinase